jgi:hypothetical protein
MAAKKLLVLTILALSVLSCSQNKVNLLRPDVAIGQVPIPQFLLERSGPISVTYQMQITNPSGEPMTLRRLDLQTVGSSPYVLRRLPLLFNKVVPPNETVVVTFDAWGYARGGRVGASEPVTVRGIAYFETPEGTLQRVFMQNFSPTRGE